MEQKHDFETDDSLVIEDEEGNETNYTIDAVIEMNAKEYVLYSNEDETFVSLITYEGDEEVLVEVTDEEMKQIIDAYEQALEEED